MLRNIIIRIISVKVMLILFMVLNLLIMISCEDFVDIDPPTTEIITETVFSGDETVLAAIRGIYANMAQSGIASGDLTSITTLCGYSADELLRFGGGEGLDFNTNNLQPLNGQISNLWTQAYRLIYYSNSLLKGLENSNGITKTFIDQIEGEAKFVRAFSHLYLVNLFGEVPIITSTDFTVNTVESQSSVAVVYQQIIRDLEEAVNLLSEDYSFSNGERVQPNRYAAIALLARVYLYLEDWETAELEATKVINNSSTYEIESDFDAVFLANSTEAIWQLQPVVLGFNTNEARSFINPEGNTPTNVAMTEILANSFEIGDQRRVNWLDSIIVNAVTYYHATKYKSNTFNLPLTEYSMVLRLAEQYLIRAEARAEQNKLLEAIADLDVIRGRAGLPLIQDTNPTISQADLLLAIEQERRVELFTEWGHRWLDLKRTDRAGSILSDLPLKDWQSTDKLYPIPQSEREINTNLTQNEGYN